MELCLIGYIVGAIITHWVIYKDNQGEIEHETASIVCVMWPVALILCCTFEVMRWVRKNFDDWSELMK